MVDSDQDMIAQADYILSIVPPRDAVSTAERFAKAATGHVRDKDKEPLFYIDLNAISPSRARMLEAICKDCPPMRYLDGGVSFSVPYHLISCPEVNERSLEPHQISKKMAAGQDPALSSPVLIVSNMHLNVVRILLRSSTSST